MAAVLLTGCAATVAGGGWGASSLQDGARSTAGFNGRCAERDDDGACTRASVTGTYQDRGRSADFPDGVRIAFSGVATLCGVYEGEDLCGPLGFKLGQTWWGLVFYRSLDKRHAGSGCALLLAQDTGNNGPDKGDYVTVSMDPDTLDTFSALLETYGGLFDLDEVTLDCTGEDAGPYEGYNANQEVLGGNFTFPPGSPTP